MAQANLKPQNINAIALLVLGMFLSSLADALSKLIASRVPIFQILWGVGLSGTLISLLYGYFEGWKKAFKSNHYKWHFVRGSAFLVASALNIFALTRLQLDQFYVFGFTNVFWIVIVAYFCFGDPIGRQRGAMIGLGFLTIVCMLNPSLNIDGIGAGAMLISAIIQAFAYVPVRLMPRDEPRALFAMSRMLITLVATTPLLFFTPIVPLEMFDMGVIVALGLIYVLAMVTVSVSYQLCSTSAVVAPFHYTQIIWGFIFGYVMFSDVPQLAVIIGSFVLVLCGCVMIFYEKRMAREARR